MTDTVCVIGGSGFVGMALRHALRAEGRSVVFIGRSPTANYGEGEIYLSRAEHDAEAIADRLGAHRVSAIVDLSYASRPNARKTDLLGDVTVNLAGLIANLDLASRLRVATYLFVSSGGTIYGDVGTVPLRENQVLEPISSYGIAKLACERAVQFYHHTRGLPTIIARPSNIYGPGQTPFTGQGIVATALASGVIGRPVTVFGDGESVRDYLFNADCSAGLIALLGKGGHGQTYNLGSGKAVTTNSLLADIAQVLSHHGHCLNISYANGNAAAIRYNVLDPTKVEKDTGWVACTSLHEGVVQTWAWLKQRVALDSLAAS